MSYGRVALLCCLLSLSAAIGGCQRSPTWNLAPVEGTVTRGGRPLRDIEVVFLADLEAGTRGPRTQGTTDETGHYRLRTDNGDDGAVVGKHRVCLLNPNPELKTPAKKQRVPPLPYESFAETPLRVEVQPGPQVIDLDLP